MQTPLIDRPDFHELWATGRFGPWSQQARDLSELGYCVLEIPAADFASDCQEVIGIIQGKMACQLQAWESGVAGSPRLQDAWRDHQAVRRLALQPSILDLLRWLYGREPFAFQTLNFATGSEQTMHSDAVHFHSEPNGFMCGVWIPLADVEFDSGPLLYYPESHRLPYYTAASLGLTPEQVAAEPHPQRFFESLWREETERNGLEQKLYMPRAAQVLVWHANLLHGGSPVLNRRGRRWSQVVHYYFADCRYTTPLRSFRPEQGGLSLRNPFDVSTGRQIWTPAEWSRINHVEPPAANPSQLPSASQAKSFHRWFSLPGLRPRRIERKLKGNLELITPSHLSGWVFHPDVPLSEVRLVCGSRLIASAPINGNRPDVAAALGREGRFGFQLEIPDSRADCTAGERLHVLALPADCSSRHWLTLIGISDSETERRLHAALAPELRGMRGHFDGLNASQNELSGWCYSRCLAPVTVWLQGPDLVPRPVSCTLSRPGMANQGHLEICGFSLHLSKWPEAAGREVWATFDQAGKLQLPPLKTVVIPDSFSRFLAAEEAESE